MTNTEIEKALAEIVIKKESECKERLARLSPDAKTEKKALMIEMGMYNLCLRAGLVYNVPDGREKVIATKCCRMEKFMWHFPKLAEYWSTADETERLTLTASLYGEIWMYDQIIILYQKEYDTAVAENDAEKIFETRIKLGVVKQMLRYWKAWRISNNIYRGLLEEVI